MGLARIAPAVAMAADTPQIEIPEDSTADAARDNRKTFLPNVYTIGQNSRYATNVAAMPAIASSKVKPAAFMVIKPILIPRYTIAVLMYHSGLAPSLRKLANPLNKLPMTSPTTSASM